MVGGKRMEGSERRAKSGGLRADGWGIPMEVEVPMPAGGANRYLIPKLSP
jgi:hypothetical protein